MNLRNFAYLTDCVAGAAHPGFGRDLAQTLQDLYAEGFRAIITAHEAPLDESMLAEQGFKGLHLPVRDFTAPTFNQLREATGFIHTQTANGDKVLVHCMGGYGRTGTVLAAYLISKGDSAPEAIRAVRHARPGSIEVQSQEDALEEFAERLNETKDA